MPLPSGCVKSTRKPVGVAFIARMPGATVFPSQRTCCRLATLPPLACQPRPVWPAGLTLTPREGAGEVQTPLRVRSGADLRVGDRVWFRHAKSGEVMERFADVHLVRGEAVEATVPTYRGEGRTFG